MARIEIVAGTLAHVHQILDNLRPADVVELTVSSQDPAAAVLEGWHQSNYRRVFVVDGEPVVVYGVCPSPFADDEGVPWMVATPAIESVPRGFLLASRSEIDRMRAGYAELRNATHQDNHTSIRWLRWLGFRISDQPVGPGGVMRMFSMAGLPELEREVPHV